MDSTPRRWVLKPLSPLLQPSDLRTIAPLPQSDTPGLDDPGGIFTSQKDDGSPDVVVQAWQVVVSQDEASNSDKCSPSSPNSPSSSTGSHCGFYSFVEDPGSPEALLNEAWMVSPQRQAKLATLKKEQGFKLQSYSSNRKPESLFSEISLDSQYKVDPNNGIQVIGQDEENALRKDIIRNQAPKNILKFKDQLGALENLDLSRSADKLIKDFSVSYSHVSSKPDHPRTAEPGAVDHEQINFTAARKQFLQIEQDHLVTFLSPPNVTTSSLQQVPLSKQVETYGCGWDTLEQDEAFGSRMSGMFHDLEPGQQELSLEVAHGAFRNKPLQENRSKCETPIEREIRLLQEREEKLRHARGLKHSDGRVEMIEIKVRRLQSPLLRTKEKSRVSFIIQPETQKQNQRKAGGLLEQHKEGSPQKLKEARKKLDQQDQRTENGPQSDVFPSCYCPHQHIEEIELSQNTGLSSITASDAHVSSMLTYQSKTTLSMSQFWKEKRESSGLQSSGQGAPDFIEKEIEEYLRREKELRDLRESKEGNPLHPRSPAPLVEQAAQMAERQFYPPSNMDQPVNVSSCPQTPACLPSFVTAQPWSCSSSSSSSMVKLEDSSYAGIHPIDAVNNEVVESTRVVRHKNQRALRWEAGVFANQVDQGDP